MQIPDDFLCLFTGRVEQRDGSYVVEVPAREIELSTIESNDSYRVAIFPASQQTADTQSRQERTPTIQNRQQHGSNGPPVEEGDIREVEIGDIGDQGDGIARIDRGYVVIVPETDLGDRVTVEIDQARENLAFAEVIEGPY